MGKVGELIEDNELKERLNSVFKIKCSVKQFDEWDEFCKKEFGDSRHVMLSTLLSFYKNFHKDFEKVKETIMLIPKLLNRLDELEKRVGGDKDG